MHIIPSWVRLLPRLPQLLARIEMLERSLDSHLQLRTTAPTRMLEVEHQSDELASMIHVLAQEQVLPREEQARQLALWREYETSDDA